MVIDLMSHPKFCAKHGQRFPAAIQQGEYGRDAVLRAMKDVFGPSLYDSDVEFDARRRDAIIMETFDDSWAD